LVAGHAAAVILDKVVCRIQPGSQAAARREMRRNVHAFCRGILVSTDEAEVRRRLLAADCGVPQRVRYNPFRDDGFRLEDGRIIAGAAVMMIDSTGIWAFIATLQA
jgi:hypothetical protein